MESSKHQLSKAIERLGKKLTDKQQRQAHQLIQEFYVNLLHVVPSLEDAWGGDQDHGLLTLTSETDTTTRDDTDTDTTVMMEAKEEFQQRDSATGTQRNSVLLMTTMVDELTATHEAKLQEMRMRADYHQNLSQSLEAEKKRLESSILQQKEEAHDLRYALKRKEEKIHELEAHHFKAEDVVADKMRYSKLLKYCVGRLYLNNFIHRRFLRSMHKVLVQVLEMLLTDDTLVDFMEEWTELNAWKSNSKRLFKVQHKRDGETRYHFKAAGLHTEIKDLQNHLLEAEDILQVCVARNGDRRLKLDSLLGSLQAANSELMGQLMDEQAKFAGYEKQYADMQSRVERYNYEMETLRRKLEHFSPQDLYNMDTNLVSHNTTPRRPATSSSSSSSSSMRKRNGAAVAIAAAASPPSPPHPRPIARPANQTLPPAPALPSSEEEYSFSDLEDEDAFENPTPQQQQARPPPHRAANLRARLFRKARGARRSIRTAPSSRSQSGHGVNSASVPSVDDFMSHSFFAGQAQQHDRQPQKETENPLEAWFARRELENSQERRDVNLRKSGGKRSINGGAFKSLRVVRALPDGRLTRTREPPGAGGNTKGGCAYRVKPFQYHSVRVAGGRAESLGRRRLYASGKTARSSATKRTYTF
jgi:hypothetical protein